MKQWLLVSNLIIGFFVFAQGSVAELGSKESILPKVLKAKTDLNGIFLLIKVSQPKNHEPSQKHVEATSEGWQKHTYIFTDDAPLKITIYSSRVGSLLWKAENSFSLNELSFYQKQGSKEIYDFSVRDPHTKVNFEFELNKETSRVRVRAKP